MKVLQRTQTHEIDVECGQTAADEFFVGIVFYQGSLAGKSVPDQEELEPEVTVGSGWLLGITKHFYPFPSTPPSAHTHTHTHASLPLTQEPRVEPDGRLVLTRSLALSLTHARRVASG